MKQVIVHETQPLNLNSQLGLPLQMKNTPSIPTRNQVYGYEYDDLGNLIMQTKPETMEEDSTIDKN